MPPPLPADSFISLTIKKDCEEMISITSQSFLFGYIGISLQ